MTYIGDSAKSIAQQVGSPPETTTILGQPADLTQYRTTHTTHPPGWTPDQVRAWITERVEAGDKFEFASTDFSGIYDREIRWLREESYKLRARGGVLIDRARELDEAIARVAKRARTEQSST